MQPAVSLITVYYNTPDDLCRLHDSIRKYLKPESYEFIVADNASQENLSSKLPGAKYLRLKKNLGFGAGCNRAAEIASAPALFFVNPDCEFIEDCVSPLLEELQGSEVCGPRVLFPDGALQLSFGPYLSIQNEAIQRERIFNEKEPEIQDWIQDQGKFHPDYVSGCAMMIRADAFRRAGGFDEEFFLYHEDVDLCKRIHDSGGTITYLPSTRIVHQKNRSTMKEPRKVSKEYRKSQVRFYRKHNGWLQNRLLDLYLLVSGKSK